MCLFLQVARRTAERSLPASLTSPSHPRCFRQDLEAPYPPRSSVRENHVPRGTKREARRRTVVSPQRRRQHPPCLEARRDPCEQVLEDEKVAGKREQGSSLAPNFFRVGRRRRIKGQLLDPEKGQRSTGKLALLHSHWSGFI